MDTPAGRITLEQAEQLTAALAEAKAARAADELDGLAAGDEGTGSP